MAHVIYNIFVKALEVELGVLIPQLQDTRIQLDAERLTGGKKKNELNWVWSPELQINSLEMFGDRDAIVLKLMPLSLAVEFAGLDVAPIDLSIQRFRSVAASTIKCTEKSVSRTKTRMQQRHHMTHIVPIIWIV